ncbi:MAG: hypothetical protein RR766_00690 [Longicatena sp.]
MKNNSLFKRVVVDNRVEKVLNEVEPGNEWVLEGIGDAYEMLGGKELIIDSGVIIDPESMEQVDLEESLLKDAIEGALDGKGLEEYEDGKYLLSSQIMGEEDSDKWLNHVLINVEDTKININRTYGDIKIYLRDTDCLGILFVNPDTGEECCITKKDFNYE